MKIKLREYQADAIRASYDFFSQGRGDGCLVVAPTGAGKSVILGEFIRRAWTEYPQTRVLMVTHVKELIEQNLSALKRQWPEAPVGVYRAGLSRKEIGKPITFAGVQSIARNARALNARTSRAARPQG